MQRLFNFFIILGSIVTPANAKENIAIDLIKRQGNLIERTSTTARYQNPLTGQTIDLIKTKTRQGTLELVAHADRVIVEFKSQMDPSLDVIRCMRPNVIENPICLVRIHDRIDGVDQRIRQLKQLPSVKNAERDWIILSES